MQLLVLHKFSWPEFSIHMTSFITFLAERIPNYSGLVTYQNHFEVSLSESQLSQEQINLIESYFLGLSASQELAKINSDLSVKTVESIVLNAQAFGNQLVVRFAAENVLMGITQAGKTKVVADYLSDVMRYALSGSLYEVIAEVDRLIADGIPSNLAPFITTERLVAFKAKIITYLGT